MVHAAVPLQAGNGGSRLAKARERFLAAEPVGPHEVREPILSSWRRSRDWRVAADRIDLVGQPNSADRCGATFSSIFAPKRTAWAWRST